jgi:hypothetical protein
MKLKSCLIAIAFLFFPVFAYADTLTDPLFAGFFSGLASRARVVQVCVVAMCIALFVIMKKFDEGNPPR